MERDIHEYDGEDITVTWDEKRCIHAQECVDGLPEVFDPDERPWIDPKEGDADDVAEVITRCPTGALQFERKDDGWEEETPDENTIEVTPDGPLYARGDIDILDENESVLLSDTRVAFCRCGASANKPLCDNTHVDIEFEDPGSVSEDGDADIVPEGDLSVTPTTDGPLHVDGAFELEGADGTTYSGEDAWLCRCGASENKPFCDGSHKKIGFSTDGE